MKKTKTIISIVIIISLLLVSIPVLSGCGKDGGGGSNVPVVSGERSDELAEKVDAEGVVEFQKSNIVEISKIQDSLLSLSQKLRLKTKARKTDATPRTM